MPTPANAAAPKYLDICQRLEKQIVAGELKPGDQLPSFLRMREQFGATPATVERTLRTLEKKGLVRREPRRGTFVTRPRAAQAKGVFGVLCDMDSHHHPYWSRLLHGIQSGAREAGIELLLLNEDSVAHGDKVDGVLLMKPGDLARQVPVDMPAVSVMNILHRLPSVGADDREGATLAVKHLLELGHRRIGFLTVGNLPLENDYVPNSDFASRQRYEAYLETLQRYGIKPDPRWVRPLRDSAKPFPGFVASGRDKMEGWLKDNWAELGLTALLTQNDIVAVQAVQVLQENGFGVPEHVSVIGFDDTSICTMIRPNLTSVNVAFERVGARAVEELLVQIHNPPAKTGGRERAILLPTELKVRSSTAQANNCNKG